MRATFTAAAVFLLSGCAIAKAEEPVADIGLSAYQLSTLTQLDPRDRTRANGNALAKIWVAERERPLWTGGHSADYPAILQTIENKRRQRERFLKRPVRLAEQLVDMAPHLIGTRRPVVPRQIWIKELPAEGSSMPPSFPSAASWERRGMSSNWAKIRDRAVYAVMVGYWPECKGEPISYGADVDWPIAISAGLCRLDCGDLAGGAERGDTFWAYPGKGCELTDPLTVAAYAVVDEMREKRRQHMGSRKTVPASIAAAAN